MSKLFLTLRQHGHTMKPEQIQTLVAEYVNASLEEIEESSLTVSRADDERDAANLALTDALEESTSELISKDFHRVVPIADELISKHGLSVVKGSLDWKRLCRGLLVGFQTAVRAELKTLDGEYTLNAHLFSSVQGNGAVDTKPAPSKLFSEVSALYFNENKRATRTDEQIKVGFERFVRVIGGDKPIGEITKADCRLYKETLLKSVSMSTANKHLHLVAHLWRWVEGQGFVAEGSNPVKGLIINKRMARKEKQERKPFSDSDLSLIFCSPIFKAQRVKHPERYWLILCLLLSGARREEIAQLDLADIREELGIPYFNIASEGHSQSLKTSASKRKVPVHSDLVRLGFLAYVSQMRKAASGSKLPGRARLFPQLEKGKNGYGDAVGKWFGRFIRQLTLPRFYRRPNKRGEW